MRSLGFAADRVTLTPHCVHNDWWAAQSTQVDRAAIRSGWRVPPDSTVVLFCARLQARKRQTIYLPQQESPVPSWFPRRGTAEQSLFQRALDLGIAERVRFLGFVNQSALPAVHKATDFMVLASEYEPFAVVVNEASCCRCPVAASDRVGATTDLMAPVNPDFVFLCGDVPVLT
jgi:hypothetical protein